jgi:hypothetical protein
MADKEKDPKSSVSKKQNPPKPATEETPAEDSFVDFGSMASIDEGASGVIPLDQLPDPASSPSVISWTQVIRQHQKQGAFPEAEPVKIDSISDKDLLEKVAQEEAAGKSSSDTDELSPGQVPMILEEDDSGAKSSSSVELSKPGGKASKPPSGSAVRFDVPPPTDDAARVIMPDFRGQEDMPADAIAEDIPDAEPIDAEEEITDAMLLGSGEEEESMSSVGLGEAAPEDESNFGDKSSILDMLLSDPGTPLSEVGPKPPPTGQPKSRPTDPDRHMEGARNTQPELILDGEDYPMALPKSGTVEPGKGWLGADEDDSGTSPAAIARRDEGSPEEAVDLYAEAPLDSTLSASGSFQVSQEQLQAAERRARQVESSAVDLSSSASLSSTFDVDIPNDERGPDSGGHSGNALLSSFEMGDVAEAEPVGAEDAVDMSMPEAALTGQDSMIRKVKGLSSKEQIDLEAELESRRQQRDEDESPEVAEEVAPAPRRRRGSEAEISGESPVPATARGRGEGSAPRKKGGGMFIGIFLGLLLAAGGAFGVWYAKLLPDPDSVFGGGDGTSDASKPKVTVNGPDVKKPAVEATPALGRQMLEAGDLAKAIDTFNKCDKTIPVLAGLGQAKWLTYVQANAGKNQPIKKDDAHVTEAIADLDQAVAAYTKEPKKENETDAVRAALWRGLIEESLGNFDAAEKIYTKAAEDFKDHAAVFTTAQKRIDALRPAGKGLGQAVRPQEALIAFMVMLQAPPMEEAAKPEAGFAFWDAVLAANKNNYAEALKSIAKAKETHLKQRAVNAGKGLNPFSDPLEQIFEQCCNHLTRYWSLCEKLYKEPSVKEFALTRSPDEVLGAILTGKMTAEKALADVAEKAMLKPDQKLLEVVEGLVKAKKDAADLQAALTKQLTDAKLEDAKLEDGLKKLIAAKADAETKMKNAAELIEKAGVKDPDLAKAITALVAARDDRDALVKSVKQKFTDAKYIEPTANDKDFLKGVDEAITRGSTDAIKLLGKQKLDVEAALKKTQDDLAKTAEQVTAAKNDTAAQKKKYEDILATAKTPSQALDLWLPALTDALANADTAAALSDVDRVLNDPNAKPEAKAKALAVKALALRNQNKTTEAIEAFGAAKKEPTFMAQPWSKQITAAEDQVRSPKVLNPTPLTAQQLLQMVDAKLKIFTAEAYPKENASLLVQRSLLKLAADDVAGAAADSEAPGQVGRRREAISRRDQAGKTRQRALERSQARHRQRAHGPLRSARRCAEAEERSIDYPAANYRRDGCGTGDDDVLRAGSASGDQRGAQAGR